MVGKFYLLLSSMCLYVGGDWVKIPQVSNTPKVTYKIKTVASLSDLPSSSVLAHSDVLSSVFSYDRPKITSSTMEMSKPTKAMETNNYFQTTVTSKSINFEHEVSDRLNREELDLQPVKLVPTKSVKRKVVYMNQTLPMKIQQSFAKTGKKIDDERDDSREEDDEDDGVTMLDDDEDINSSEEVVSEEIYEYEEETATSSTTTKAPRKVPIKKSPPRNPQKRVMDGANKGSKLLNSLSFTHFLKFLKNIQDTFTTRTAKNINDKIQMLREFRDNLLLTINQRIKNLWKTQTKSKKNFRNKRTVGGGGGGSGWMDQGGAMDFPSAEGALLSISFLTFAVFLIKLVLVNNK